MFLGLLSAVAMAFARLAVQDLSIIVDNGSGNPISSTTLVFSGGSYYPDSLWLRKE
jgi:hypothetical protein